MHSPVVGTGMGRASASRQDLPKPKDLEWSLWLSLCFFQEQRRRVLDSNKRERHGELQRETKSGKGTPPSSRKIRKIVAPVDRSLHFPWWPHATDGQNALLWLSRCGFFDFFAPLSLPRFAPLSPTLSRFAPLSPFYVSLPFLDSRLNTGNLEHAERALCLLLFLLPFFSCVAAAEIS